MKKPLVSILIPCFNADRWLSQALESTLSQTWENTEVILVDDGSTDCSLAIAQNFQSAKVKVISQQNQGASAARNRALKEAQGDFMQYLDADDLLAPDKIKLQLKLLEFDGNSSYVLSGEWARFYQTPSEALFTHQSLWSDMHPVDWLVCAWESNLMMHPAAWLVPRKISEKVGYWNENISLNDDGEYFCRVILASEGVKFCEGAKSYYRSGNFHSLSDSSSQKARESQFLSLHLCTNNLLAVEDSLRTRRVCAMVFQRFIYEVYPDASDLLQKASMKVQELGGSNLKPVGSPSFELLTSILGWRQAKILQSFLYRCGYRKIAMDRLKNKKVSSQT